MKLELVMADPAGNRTALVLSPVPPEGRGPLAARLMALPELHAEQVGFVLPPSAGGLFRLEMMGGEFCGNAARSFGLYLAGSQGRSGEMFRAAAARWRWRRTRRGALRPLRCPAPGR